MKLALAFPSVVCLVLASCGGDDLSDASRRLAALVPADAVVFAQFGSLDLAQERARELVTEFEPREAGKVDVDELLSLLGPMAGDTGLIDRGRPIGVALSLPMGGMPAPTFIVPARDPGGYAASLPQMPGMPGPVTADGYVVVSLGGVYERPGAPAAIVEGLPAGLVTARIDVKQLVATFGPMIEMGLAQAERALENEARASDLPGVDVSVIMKQYLDMARALIDSAETLDVGASYSDGMLELRASLTAVAGSAMDGWESDRPSDLRELAALLTGGRPIAILGSCDAGAFAERMKPFMHGLAAAYDEPMRETMLGWIEDFEPLLAKLGPAFAIDGGFGEDGLGMTIHFQSSDPKALVQGYAKLIESGPFDQMGVDFAEPKTTRVDGVEVSEFQCSFDYDKLMSLSGVDTGEMDERQRAEFDAMMNAMYGEGGMRIRFASNDRRILMVFGGDDADLRRAIARLSAPAGKVPPAIERALALVGDDEPCLVYSVDVPRLVAGMPSFGGQSMPFRIDENASAPMILFGGIDGRQWRGGMTWDIRGMARAFSQR